MQIIQACHFRGVLNWNLDISKEIYDAWHSVQAYGKQQHNTVS